MFVNYRTADIAPFPASFEDACQGLQYVWEHKEELGIDANRIAVGGDSSGGTLAAACSLWARDEAKIPVCFQFLVYPATDSRVGASPKKRIRDYMRWQPQPYQMWKIYLRDGDFGKPQYAAPMLAESFEQLPNAYIEVEELDPLRQDGISYANALKKAGVRVQLEDVKGTVHGFDFFTKREKTIEMIQIREKALMKVFQIVE